MTTFVAHFAVNLLLNKFSLISGQFFALHILITSAKIIKRLRRKLPLKANYMDTTIVGINLTWFTSEAHVSAIWSN